MGYDIHITRREDWPDDGNDITADEWLTLIKRDPELRINEEYRMNGPYFVVWSGSNPTEPEWLDWADGRIYTKYPSVAMIDKMISIAEQFGANVQGDDSERYRKLPRPLQIGDQVQNDRGDIMTVVGFQSEGRDTGHVLIRDQNRTLGWIPQSLTLLKPDMD